MRQFPKNFLKFWCTKQFFNETKDFFIMLLSVLNYIENKLHQKEGFLRVYLFEKINITIITKIAK